MNQKLEWTVERIECPESRGQNRVLLKWTRETGKPALIGVHCGNQYLRDYGGGNCNWSCWDTLAKTR